MVDGHQWIASMYARVADTPPGRLASGLADALNQRWGVRALQWVCLEPNAQADRRQILVDQLPAELPAEGVIKRVVEAPADRDLHEFCLLQEAAGAARADELDAALLHAANAWSICNRYARRGVGAPSSVVEAAPDTGRATVDGEGRILWANPRFTALITDRLDAGHALESLPFQLRWSPRVAAGGIIWRGLHFQVRRNHDDFDLTVRAARQDMPAITEREWAVVRELCAGKTYRQIGETLHMAPTTASSHTYKLMDKLGLRRKHELIQWCQRQAVRVR